MSDMVSSLHCLFSYDNKLGGSVHAALNVCKYLSKEGQTVEVVAPFSKKDSVDYLKTSYPELNCHKVAKSFPKRFSNSMELAGWLERNAPRFQVVEIHGIWVLATWQAVRICKKLKVPYFIRPHGSLDPFDLQKHAPLKKLLGPLYVRWLLRDAAGVICTADLEVERLVTYGASPPRYAMPLPVPLPKERGDGRAFRNRHGIPSDAFIVLFMSRIDYKKGLEFLIPALGRLKNTNRRLWFVLAGAGKPEFVSTVREWLTEHQVQSFTSEVGFVSGQEKLDALASANVFALTSLNENFGIVNVEAMHAGLPLLISNEVYICQEIEAAGAGVVCKPNIESVVEKLMELLKDPLSTKAMGENGMELVQRLYQPETATATLLKLYQRTKNIS